MKAMQRTLLLFLLVFTSITVWAVDGSVYQRSGFIPNGGQWPSAVKYRIGIQNGALFVRDGGLTYVLYDGEAVKAKHDHSHAGNHETENTSDLIRHHAVQMQLMGANSGIQALTEDGSTTRYNYYQGNIQSKWASGLQAWKKINYPEIYPNTDWIIYTGATGIKYDFNVKPGGNASLIKMQFTGSESVSIRNNTLYIQTSLGEIIEQAPVAWQEENGVRELVACSFRQNQDGSIGFDLGQYDHSKLLTIDPQLIFATYSGSTDDNWGYTATYDNAGNGYSGGIVFGANFPTTTGAYQEDFGGGVLDVGILKYNPDGSDALYVTYIGGSSPELPHSMIVNEYDELLIFGTTGSDDFPVTSGAYSSDYKGGPSTSFDGITFNDGLDMFVCRLSNDGSQLLGSTLIGGTGNDGLNESLAVNYADQIRGALWVDANNNVYVGTSTQSTDFPTTANAIQPNYGGGSQDGIVIKLNGNLSQLIWSTYLGGSDADGIFYLVVDTDERAVVTGGTQSSNFPTSASANQGTFGGDKDGFASVIDSAGTTLIASTFIGTGGYDQSFIVGTDKTNHIYLFGQTEATGNTFNVNTAIGVSGGNQFLMKYDPLLTTIVWSNAFGSASGSPDIAPTALLVDLCDKIYCTGWGGVLNPFGQGTNGLITTPDAFQSSTDNNDFYLYVMDNQAQSLIYASFLGGPNSLDHVDGGTSRFDRKGVIYQSICAGCGGQSDFPGITANSFSPTNNSFNCNNLLVKFDFESPITVSAFASITDPIGCAPYTAEFSNTSVNADLFSWRIGDTEISTASNFTYTFTESGTYEVVLIATSSLTCNAADTVSLTVEVISDIQGTLLPLTACKGDEVILGPDEFDDPYFQFRWNPGTTLSDSTVRKPTLIADTSLTYSVIVSVGTCVDTISQQLTVYGTERTLLGLAEDCIYDSLEIGPIGEYIPGTTFSWTPATGLSSTIDQNPLAYLIGDRTYTVLIQRPEGCVDTMDVPVNARWDVMDAGPDVNACSGEPATIGLPDSQGNHTYEWTPTAFLTNETSATPSATVFQETQFNVIQFPETTSNECPARDSLIVKIVAKPTALFGFELYPDCKGMNVAFSDSSISSEQLLWIFSNGQTSTEENPLTVFPFKDSLVVQLIAKNGECRDTFTFSQYIDDISKYYKENNSNAFSPNNDGINDCFSPALQLVPQPWDIAFVPCSDIFIYNRWGELIFSAEDNDSACWNGKTESGVDLPEGVYYYRYRFGSTERAGFVELKRQ